MKEVEKKCVSLLSTRLPSPQAWLAKRRPYREWLGAFDRRLQLSSGVVVSLDGIAFGLRLSGQVSELCFDFTKHRSWTLSSLLSIALMSGAPTWQTWEQQRASCRHYEAESLLTRLLLLVGASRPRPAQSLDVLEFPLSAGRCRKATIATCYLSRKDCQGCLEAHSAVLKLLQARR